MGRSSRKLVGAAIAVAALVVGPLGVGGADAQGGAGDFCDRFAAADRGDLIGPEELQEASGLAASAAHADLLWAHNDLGDEARLFALDEHGGGRGIFTVEGAEATDWEDIDVGPGPDAGRSYLYIGDIGNDVPSLREDITVYRVPEPEAAPDGDDATLGGTEAFLLAYPEKRVDAETLMVDPITGDVFVVTRSIYGVSTIYRAAADVFAAAADPDTDDDTPVVMEDVGTITVTDPGRVEGTSAPGTKITGGDISPDGSIVLLRTYKQVLAFARPEGTTVAQALAGEWCDAPQVGENQGEAITFTAGGDAYVTLSEVGASAPDLPLNRFAVDPPAGDGDPPPADEGDDPSTTASIREGDDGSSPVPWVVGGVAVVAVVGVVARVRRKPDGALDSRPPTS